MSARSIRRAAERKQAKQARKAARAEQQLSQQTATVAAVAAEEQNITATAATAGHCNETLLRSAFDFTDEENDELALPNSFAPSHQKEKALAAGASVGAAAAPAPVTTTTTISDARLAANRANAQLSTGPRSSEGKAKASLNAVKTGLTGQTVVLPSEDAQAYEDHVARINAKYKPAAADEEMLTQSIADHEWRLARIPALEASIHAIGLREFSNEFEDEPNPHTRNALIRGKVMLHYRKDLTNLAIQERRLRNHREKDMEELRLLQEKRRGRRHNQLTAARQIVKENKTVDLVASGFDFTNEELAEFFDSAPAISSVTGAPPDFDQFLDVYRNELKAA